MYTYSATVLNVYIMRYLNFYCDPYKYLFGIKYKELHVNCVDYSLTYGIIIN